MSTKLSQDVSIGENLRILRKRAGYSQERAAAQLELMGISMSREIISQMESGHHNIRISVLLAFKQVYEVDSFDDFFGQQEKGGDRLKQEPIGIGQNLRKLRQDAGYSQSQVAALLCERGVYMTTDIYKKIEQNKYNIRISELNALKELYQVGYGELFQTDS